MNRRKIAIMTILVGLLMTGWSYVDAPVCQFKTYKVRLTKWSPKQRGETYKNAMGGRLKEGDLASRMFPLGTVIYMPDGSWGVVKDRPSKWAHEKFRGRLVDECLIQSIKSKPKTRAVNKELRKYDEGWGEVRILQ